MASLATILIAARNAGDTIRRAVASAAAQGSYPILVIDDFSTDETVALARDAGGSRLKVVRPPRHESLGTTRHTGLMAVDTPYGVWLDSDDELLPGRVSRLVQAMDTEHADLIADEVELYDGVKSSFVKRLRIPSFLFGRHPLARLFERNYLPGPGVIGFRTEFAQKIGYDCQLHGPEDTDFLLRCICAGARFHLLPVLGYRLYSYPNSVSRNIENQRRMYRSLLLKHQYSDVRRLYSQAGHDAQIAAWGLVSLSLFREDYQATLEFIEEAGSQLGDPAAVLEPDGACAAPEGWRILFHRGTTLLLLGRNLEAFELLREAEKSWPTPEGANNLGVALRRLHNTSEAQYQFEKSLQRFSSFHDAKLNLSNEQSMRITSHPLRFWASRDDYFHAPGFISGISRQEPRYPEIPEG
jgi:glycosyltransferase involved in cell wall biosynthesis